MSGGINAVLAINGTSGSGGTAAADAAIANVASNLAAGSSSAPSAITQDTTSVLKYPDGSTVTTVRSNGEVVSIAVTSPTLTTAAPATSGGTVSSTIDVTA